MRRSMKYLAVILTVAMTLQVTAISGLTEDVLLDEPETAEFTTEETQISEDAIVLAEADDMSGEDMLLSAEELLELADEPADAADEDELIEDTVSDEVEEEAVEEVGTEEAAEPEEAVPAEEEQTAFEDLAEEDISDLQDGFVIADEEEEALPEADTEGFSDDLNMEEDISAEAAEETAAVEMETEEPVAVAVEDQSTEETEEAVLAEGEEAVEEEALTEIEEILAEEEAVEEDASVENAADPTKVSKAFPDTNFQNYVKAKFTGGSNTITAAQLKAIKAADTLDLSGYAVTDLTGIEYFTSIETLKLSGNTAIKTVDLSKNTTLVIVDLSKNTAMSSLTLTGCSKIQQLNLNGCSALKSVGLTACTNLQTLTATSSGLTSLDVSKNTKLQTLYCSNTQIETLNVSSNTALRQLECSNAMLASVTLGTNSNLFYLDLSDNKRLNKIDVSKVTALRELELQNTAVVNLDLSNHASLYNLDLSNTPLKTLNLSGCKAIESLDINNRTGKGWNVTTITTLNVANCTALRQLYCEITALSSLTITGCTTLEELTCNDTAVSSLTLTDCTALHYLDCSDTAVTSLDVSKNKNLQTLYITNTGISSLDVTGNESLANLGVEETGITTLDLRKNPNLKKLYSGRTMTKIYMNELKNNVAGTGRVILDTSRFNNSSAQIIVYFPLNGTSWNKTTRNTYSGKSANITWWPYDPQTGTIYCKNSEEKYGKKTGEHNWGTIYDKKPTCAASGKTHIGCKACGEVKPNTSKVVKATGKHKYGSWTVKIPANSYSPRVEHKVCQVCGHEVTRTKGKKLASAKTIFQHLQPKATAVSSTKIKLTWNRLDGAYIYYVYGAKCGSSLKLLKGIKQKTSKTISYTQSKLKAGTYYKYGVVAYSKDSSGKLKLIEASTLLHVPTSGGKYTEYKTAVANRKKVTLKASKKARIKVAGNKRLAAKAVSIHEGARYESSNKSIVTVNKKGRITAKSVGTAYIYAYLQDGKFARIKVTVK